MNLEKWLEDREDWRPFVDLILVPPNRVEVLQEFPDADITGFWNTDDEPIFTTFGFSRAAAYVKLRRTGSTDRFAHMVAVQSAPRIKTDST
ncbi:MAG: hypothetical protein KDD44_08095, partial [Bdellovibrionales bacterium]|nr:hypothetical protein [Bdellovibrionales bacterium]